MPDLVQWLSNEVCVQRYEPGAIGVTPHLDHKQYAGLVVIVTHGHRISVGIRMDTRQMNDA